ncbi:hypothetical protein [Mycolicibacter longobardus]|uniref:hypothetical protein n=1 Tax=Mycolicibacter longobardus TaxID=1108812 RepID=UPI001054F13D|nr:hypothetical protein [Mycolicibacter longobardus]
MKAKAFHVLVGGLLLAGCSSGGSPAGTSTGITAHSTPSVNTGEAEAGPASPTVGSEGGFPDLNPVVGHGQTTGAGATITPHSFEYPTNRSPDFPAEKGQWAVLDGELCAGSEPINKTGYGFSLVDAEHHEYKPFDSSRPPFSPSITGTGTLLPSECTRGLVAFDVPQGTNIVFVRWEYPGDGGPLRWAVS